MRYVPEDLAPYFNSLSEEGKKSFKKQFSRRRKSGFVSYFAWFFLGWHYAYLGKWGVQIIYWLTGGGFLIWMLIDLFRMPWIVASVNAKIAYEVMEEIKAIEKS